MLYAGGRRGRGGCFARRQSNRKQRGRLPLERVIWRPPRQRVLTYNSAAASTLLAAQEPFLVYAQKQSYPSLSCEESQLLLASSPPSPPPTSITTTNTTTTTPPLLPSLPPPPLPTTTQLPARNLCLSASSLPPPPPSPLLYHHHHVTICL